MTGKSLLAMTLLSVAIFVVGCGKKETPEAKARFEAFYESIHTGMTPREVRAAMGRPLPHGLREDDLALHPDSLTYNDEYRRSFTVGFSNDLSVSKTPVQRGKATKAVEVSMGISLESIKARTKPPTVP